MCKAILMQEECDVLWLPDQDQGATLQRFDGIWLIGSFQIPLKPTKEGILKPEINVET